MTNIKIITTPAALLTLANRLAGEKIIACDLEADSMHHYREQVCLLQISVPDANYLIDPLACPDLSPLAPLFADPTVRKLFHGADYDVRSMYRDFGIGIENLFDTMIACQFLGETEVGLAAALRKRFGVELDKRFQQADWSRRPIPADMLAYAVMDTSLLIPFYLQLEKELREKGRLEWVLEECEILSGVRTVERRDDPLFLRFKGASKMSPSALAVLEELLKFRDAEAERRDVPPFKVLGTETIRELAERKPIAAMELGGITGFSARLVERYGQAVLAAVGRGMAVSPACCPHFPSTPRPKRLPSQEVRLKRLKVWREEKSLSLGLAPGLLANNVLLESLAERGIQKEQGSSSPSLKEWQRLAIGEELADLLEAD